MFVLADGNCLVSTGDQHSLQLLTPAGWLFSIAGNDDDETFVDGPVRGGSLLRVCLRFLHLQRSSHIGFHWVKLRGMKGAGAAG
jgi:hypothetical protein